MLADRLVSDYSALQGAARPLCMIVSRKNRQQGSGKLMRMCSCSRGGNRGSEDMCMVHTFWDKYWQHLPEGHQPWRNFSGNAIRTALRKTLGALGVEKAKAYGTHDFRRGHAEASLVPGRMRWHIIPYGCQDMRASGCTLAQTVSYTHLTLPTNSRV